MKSRIAISTVFLFLSYGLVCGQNTWTQMADFGGGTRSSEGIFTIGTKGYFAAGDNNGGFFKDFWEYDQLTNTWTQKTSLPIGVREAPVGFSIGKKGYVGTGYGMSSLFYTDFWVWDQDSNTWSQIADFPGAGGIGLSACVAFSIGGKGYVGTGGGWGSGTLQFTNEFWEYDTSSNSWTQKTNFPGDPRWFAVGFAINNKGYIGTGMSYNGSTNVFYNDFWEYDPAIDNWSQKSDFGGAAREGSVGFSIGTKGYIGSGGEGNSAGFCYNDFWEWNQATNTWLQKANYPGGGGAGTYCSGGFSIGSKGYIGTGRSPNTAAQLDFWEYTPDSTSNINEVCNAKFILNIFPNPFSFKTIIRSSLNLKDATLTISNTLGQEIEIIKNISGQEIELRRDNLSNGVYFIQLTEDNKIIATNKIIITD